MTPAVIYYGSAISLRREIGLADCYDAPWQIVPFGPFGEEFTPEGADSQADMMSLLREYTAQFPDAHFVFHA